MNRPNNTKFLLEYLWVAATRRPKREGKTQSHREEAAARSFCDLSAVFDFPQNISTQQANFTMSVYEPASDGLPAYFLPMLDDEDRNHK